MHYRIFDKSIIHRFWFIKLRLCHEGIFDVLLHGLLKNQFILNKNLLLFKGPLYITMKTQLVMAIIFSA